MSVKATFYVGAHVPQRKTVVETMEVLRAVGGNILQLFVANPRSGKITERGRARYFAEAGDVRDYCARHDFKLVVHSAYPLNFASDEAESYLVETVLDELAIAEALGAMGVIVHTGRWAAARPPTEPQGLANMRARLLEVLRRSAGTAPRLILETSSGAGTELLPDIAALSAFYADVKAAAGKNGARLALCMDTAHVHAAGAAPAKALNALLGAVGSRAVALVHMNNTPIARGGHVDRHAALLDPKGTIGLPELRAVARLAREAGVPVVMETPETYAAEVPWIRAVRRRALPRAKK